MARSVTGPSTRSRNANSSYPYTSNTLTTSSPSFYDERTSFYDCYPLYPMTIPPRVICSGSFMTTGPHLMIVIPCFGGQASSARLYPPAPFYYGEGTSIYDSYPCSHSHFMTSRASLYDMSSLSPFSRVSLYDLPSPSLYDFCSASIYDLSRVLIYDFFLGVTL
jgi:hypothetical protein